MKGVTNNENVNILSKIASFFKNIYYKILNYTKKEKENILRNLAIYFTIFICSLISVSIIFIDGFPYGDDSIYHFANVYDMVMSFKEGHFSPISANLGNGLGIGKQLFYSPLPHLVVAIIVCILNISIISAFKIVIFLSIFISGIFMYKLAMRLSKDNVLISIMASAVFVLYPYRLFDYFCRSAFAEGFAIMFLPLLFLGIYDILHEEEPKVRSYVTTILGAVFLFLSHNLTAVYTYLFIILYLLFNLNKLINLFKNKKSRFYILISLFLVVGLISVNLFTQLELMNTGLYNISNSERMWKTVDHVTNRTTDAFVYSGFMYINYIGTYYYDLHSVSQLIFMIILFPIISSLYIYFDLELKKHKLFKKLHYFITTFIYLFVIYLLFNKEETTLGALIVAMLYLITNYLYKDDDKENNNTKEFNFVIVAIVITLIMISQKFIWKYIPKLLLSIQFPWRLFSLCQIFAAMLCALLFVKVKNKKLAFYCLTILVAMLFVGNQPNTEKRLIDYRNTTNQTYDNWHYTVDDSLYQHAFAIGACAEYCPQMYYYGYGTKTSIYPKSLFYQVNYSLFYDEYRGKAPYAIDPVVLEGDAQINVTYKKAPNYEILITANTDSLVQVPLIYYPGYEITIINNNTQEEIKMDAIEIDGLISFTVHEGSYTVKTDFVGSTTRKVSKVIFVISIIGISGFIGYGIYENKKRRNIL